MPPEGGAAQDGESQRSGNRYQFLSTAPTDGRQTGWRDRPWGSLAQGVTLTGIARVWIGRMQAKELEEYAIQRRVVDAQARYTLPWIARPWWASGRRRSPFLHPSFRSTPLTHEDLNIWGTWLNRLVNRMRRGTNATLPPEDERLGDHVAMGGTLGGLLTNEWGHRRNPGESSPSQVAYRWMRKAGVAAVAAGHGWILPRWGDGSSSEGRSWD